MQYLPGKAYPTFNSGSQQARLVTQQTQWPAPQQAQWHSSQQPQPPAPHTRQNAQAVYQSFPEEARRVMDKQLVKAVEEDGHRNRRSSSRADPRYGPAAGVAQGGTSYAHRQHNVQHTTFPNASPLAKDQQYQCPRPLYSATESTRNTLALPTSAAPPSTARKTAKLTTHSSRDKPYAAKNRGRDGSLEVRKGKMYPVCSECGLFWNSTKERNQHEKNCTPENRARKYAMREYFCGIVECGEECGYVAHERGAMWNHQNGKHGQGSADNTLL